MDMTTTEAITEADPTEQPVMNDYDVKPLKN